MQLLYFLCAEYRHYQFSATTKAIDGMDNLNKKIVIVIIDMNISAIHIYYYFLSKSNYG